MQTNLVRSGLQIYVQLIESTYKGLKWCISCSIPGRHLDRENKASETTTTTKAGKKREEDNMVARTDKTFPRVQKQ